MDPEDMKPVDEMEQTKKNIKGCCCLSGDYQIWEVLQALVMNDGPKLDEMRSRCQLLQSAYDKFVEDVDSGDEDRKNIAMNSFRRPE